MAVAVSISRSRSLASRRLRPSQAKVRSITHKLGTMIEIPRACLLADRIAETVEFFSFGTNDLTQAVFSFSREDAENKFLPFYNENGILQDNPFEVLDIKGTGKLMELAIEWGRQTRPGIVVYELHRVPRLRVCPARAVRSRHRAAPDLHRPALRLERPQRAPARVGRGEFLRPHPLHEIRLLAIHAK